MIQGMEDIGWALMGAEISWGSSSLASTATFLSDSMTFDGSGGLILVLARFCGSEAHAARILHNGSHERRVQLWCR
jgi:hypothetical protein